MTAQFMPLIVGATLAVSASLALLAWGVYRLRFGESTQERVERLTRSLRPLEDAELSRSFGQRILVPWLRGQVHAAGRLAPTRNVEKLQLNLAQAGYPRRMTLLDLLGLKLLAAVATAALFLVLSATRGTATFSALAMAAALAGVAFLAPDFWLGSLVRQRQKQITRSLPDALDMLTICVDAGAGLDAAMMKISDKWQNAVADELGKVVVEVRIGATRREALQNMVQRTGVADVASFVAVLLQAEQFGLSISDVLHAQSDQMRVRRWQRAEEEVRKIPIKLLFPLVFMIFPAMLSVVLGPAIPVLADVFARMGGQ